VLGFAVLAAKVISKKFLFVAVDSYISKITSAGQLTLPKKLRKALGLEGRDYVEVALVGRTVVIRRLREEEAFLDAISQKIKRTGLTRARVDELLNEVKRDAWKKRYREAVR
jgi:AbrB family looped-hinge helix DNA binding protein